MSSSQWSVVAVLAAAAAAFLAMPRYRRHAWVAGSARATGRRKNGLDRLRGLLAPVEGAPGSFVRVACAVIAGCVVMPVAGITLLPLYVSVGVATLGVFVGLGRWTPAELRGRDRVVRAELPAVCTLLAVCLEAGLPLRNAVGALADAAQEPMAGLLRRLHTSVQLGVSERDAWHELGDAQPAFAVLARELGHAAGSGMTLAPVLRHHAREAQRAAHGTAQARARKAGVSSVVPLMVCFLPAFILIGVVPIVGGVATRVFQ